MRDLNNRTTIEVICDDKEHAENIVPAKTWPERFYKLLDFYERNYKVSNFDYIRKEIERQLNLKNG